MEALFKKITVDNDKETEKELEKFIDYRNFMNYDIKITDKNGNISFYSKGGKGKSGGVRVLTYTVQKVNPEKIVITLLSIFDKSDIENVSDSYIKSLVKEVKNQYED